VASFGLSNAAEAIRDRVGRDARYTSFVAPSVRHSAQPRRPWGRLLWTGSLILLVVVLVLVVLVALGL
jgi:hypothetical protein